MRSSASAFPTLAAAIAALLLVGSWSSGGSRQNSVASARVPPPAAISTHSSPSPPASVSASRKATWDLGSTLSLAALGYDGGAPQRSVDAIFSRAGAHAKTLGAVVPAFPKKTGKASEDSAAIIHYLLRGASGPIKEHLASAYGMDHVALYDVAVKSNLLMLLYAPGDSTGVTIADVIERDAPRAGLPDRIWKPVTTKVRAGVSFDAVKSAVGTMHSEASDFLAGEGG